MLIVVTEPVVVTLSESTSVCFDVIRVVDSYTTESIAQMSFLNPESFDKMLMSFPLKETCRPDALRFDGAGKNRRGPSEKDTLSSLLFIFRGLID